MTVREAARRLEISPSLCYRLLAEDRLKCVRIGMAGRRGKIIIRESDLREFLRTLETPSPSGSPRAPGWPPRDPRGNNYA